MPRRAPQREERRPAALAAPDPRHGAKGELRADRLDLAALSQIANRLPLGEAAHRLLKGQAPQGLVHRSTAAQAEELLGRQQGTFRALARGFQDLLAQHGFPIGNSHGAPAGLVVLCCVRRLREFLTLCPQSICLGRHCAGAAWLR